MSVNKDKEKKEKKESKEYQDANKGFLLPTKNRSLSFFFCLFLFSILLSSGFQPMINDAQQIKSSWYYNSESSL